MLSTLTFGLLPCVAHQAQATSIVVKLTENKVVIAADTLGIERGTKYEDQCKIEPLGKYAFAASGIASFLATSPLSSWDAKAEAQAAYRSHDADIDAAASDWLERTERYFGHLSRIDRARARSMAAPSDHTLAIGIFVGWNLKGQPEFILEAVRYKEPSLGQVEHLIERDPPRVVPFTSHPTTLELIEGNTNRAREARTEWKVKSKMLPKKELGWRWLEFLIQKTGEFADVGRKVDVMQFTQEGNPEWLQTCACTK